MILIVEDDLKVQENIKELLECEGYNVNTAFNANEALEHLKNGVPDLIISDVMMPGKSGFDLFKIVKANPTYYNVPFIFLTAKANISDIRDGMNLGSDDYITKPFRVKDLLTSVKIRLENKKKYEDKIGMVTENLSSWVPHELRTPLVTILGYPDLLLQYFSDLSDDEKIDMIKSIKANALRLKETVEKFIFISDLNKNLLLSDHGKNNKVEHVKDIKELILESGLMISTKYNRQDSFSATVESAALNISEKILRELIEQLIDNAYKFSDPPAKVQVNTEMTPNGYLVEVIDHGIGLSDEEIKKIDTFIQFDRDRNALSGLGMGLNIVREILKYYDSNLKIESKKNEGSKFSFLLSKNLIN